MCKALLKDRIQGCGHFLNDNDTNGVTEIPLVLIGNSFPYNMLPWAQDSQQQSRLHPTKMNCQIRLDVRQELVLNARDLSYLGNLLLWII